MNEVDFVSNLNFESNRHKAYAKNYTVVVHVIVKLVVECFSIRFRVVYVFLCLIVLFLRDVVAD